VSHLHWFKESSKGQFNRFQHVTDILILIQHVQAQTDGNTPTGITHWSDKTRRSVCCRLSSVSSVWIGIKMFSKKMLHHGGCSFLYEITPCKHRNQLSVSISWEREMQWPSTHR